MTNPPINPNNPIGSGTTPTDPPLQNSPNLSQDRQDPDMPAHAPQKTVAHVERNRGGYLTWFIITIIVLGLIVLAAWYVSP